MDREFDCYLISLKDEYVKKFLISGLDFFISLTDNEDEAYQFFEESEAEDVNHYYCNGQGEVLYVEAEDFNDYDEYEDEDQSEEEE